MKLLVLSFLAGAIALAQNDPATWTVHGKNSQGWRYSELDQINIRNVSKLVPQWMFQTNAAGKNETTPLVFDRMMFVTGPNNFAWALDALTGRLIWSYKSAPQGGLILCCGPVNRGFAVKGNKLFKVNLDGSILALDPISGAVLWQTAMEDYKKGYTATSAPLVIKNLVVTGMAGAEFGTRGFIDAYDADTGKRVWRFYTIPGEGEPGGDTWTGQTWKRGGASTWVTGTYDPDTNLIFWGTGNPGPDLNGDVRPGDNLYACSIVAIDADTG
jgi:alcohol dehydrogenase (cytochrome c)